MLLFFSRAPIEGVARLDGTGGVVVAGSYSIAAITRLDGTAGIVPRAAVDLVGATRLNGEGLVRASIFFNLHAVTRLDGIGGGTFRALADYAPALKLEGLGTIRALLGMDVLGATRLNGTAGAVIGGGEVGKLGEAILVAGSRMEAYAAMNWTALARLEAHSDVVTAPKLDVKLVVQLDGFAGMAPRGSAIWAAELEGWTVGLPGNLFTVEEVNLSELVYG